MSSQHSGSFRLFRFAGIDVFLHWSWLLVAGFVVSNRQHAYSSPLWNLFEYRSLFGIVLLHEFGHALACRQVGGHANTIVLWPLGGIAYVAPPQRPGAVLWSLVAGPLVNVVLAPIFFGALLVLDRSGAIAGRPDLASWLWMVGVINLTLLIFNLLPIYPLDGGQILRSLLWFAIGPRRSMLVASGIGLVGVAALIGFALWRRSIWIGLIAVYLGTSCWSAFKYARMPEREPRPDLPPPPGG